MTRSQSTSVAVAFSVGFVAALLYAKATTKPPLTESAAKVATPAAAAENVAAVRADYERKLADLATQLAAANASLANAANGRQPPGIKREDEVELFKARLAADRAAVRDRDNAKLLAAGFSQHRIDFIKKRAAELKVEFRLKQDLDRQQGLPPDIGAALAHNIDPDIDLLRELGDEEYTRYRQALGRSIGAKIIEILPGSTGDGAGLKVGDEIVSYNGTRVFNNGDLGSVMKQYMQVGTSVPVDVVRNGQKIRVSVPAGSNMGIRSSAVPAGLPADVQEMLQAAEKMATEN